MDNQNPSRPKSCSAHLGYLLKEVAAATRTRASHTLIKDTSAVSPPQRMRSPPTHSRTGHCGWGVHQLFPK